MHLQVGVVRIRMYNDEVSGLILRWRGSLLAFWHPLNKPVDGEIRMKGSKAPRWLLTEELGRLTG